MIVKRIIHGQASSVELPRPASILYYSVLYHIIVCYIMLSYVTLFARPDALRVRPLLRRPELDVEEVTLPAVHVPLGVFWFMLDFIIDVCMYMCAYA